MTNNRRNQGFTLIELTLALAFISFLLLFMVAAILQVTRLYVKGSALRQINQTGRQLMDDVSTSLRASATPLYIKDNNRLCVGTTSYAWNSGDEVVNKFNDDATDSTTLRFVSVHDPAGELCSYPHATLDRQKTTDLVGPEITPLRFSVEQHGQLWDVSLILGTSGDNIPTIDLSTSTFACDPSNQFCAFGDFSTSIYARGGV